LPVSKSCVLGAADWQSIPFRFYLADVTAFAMTQFFPFFPGIPVALSCPECKT
jgi:hypothetical protein